MSENIKDLFQEMSKADWLENVRAELKGQGLETLLWHIEEGLSLDPYYTVDDLKNLKIESTKAGLFPYTGGYKVNGNNWIISERTAYSSLDSDTLESLLKKSGIEGFEIELDRDSKLEALHKLAREAVPCFIRGMSLDQFRSILKSEESNSLPWQLHLNHMDKDISDWISLSKQCGPELKLFSIPLTEGKHSEQIAGALIKGYHLIKELIQEGLSVDEAASRVGFESLGSTAYFLEIAKLRSLRNCWSRVVNSFEPKEPVAAKSRILSRLLSSNNEADKPEEKLIHLSIMATASILGGCDAMIIEPYKTDSLAKAMTRNIQHILKHEAFLGRVADPLGGSYSIEVLTDKLSRKAWEGFKSEI